MVKASLLTTALLAAVAVVPVSGQAQPRHAAAHDHSHHNHKHVHGPGCGHVAVVHDGHIDYLHDGHLHHVTPDGRIEEHAIPVTRTNPDGHTGQPAMQPTQNAMRVRHGDHYDYLVNGRLSHPHERHYDDHGPVQIAGQAGAGQWQQQSTYSHGYQNPCEMVCVPVCY